MGWASGSDLFSSVIKVLKKNVPSVKRRKEMYRKLIAAFKEHDWDTLEECLGEDRAYDAVYHELYPDLYDDDEDSF